MLDGKCQTNWIADCGLRMADGRFGEKGEWMTQLSNSKDGLEFTVEQLSIALTYYHCTYHASPKNCHSPVELPVPGLACRVDGPSASTCIHPLHLPQNSGETVARLLKSQKCGGNSLAVLIPELVGWYGGRSDESCGCSQGLQRLQRWVHAVYGGLYCWQICVRGL